jgi:hypothetical protein
MEASDPPRVDARNWLAAGFFAAAAAIPAGEALVAWESHWLGGHMSCAVLLGPGLLFLSVAACRVRPLGPLTRAYMLGFALVLAQSIVLFGTALLTVMHQTRFTFQAFRVASVSALFICTMALISSLLVAMCGVRGRLLVWAELVWFLHLWLAGLMIPVE